MSLLRKIQIRRDAIDPVRMAELRRRFRIDEWNEEDHPRGEGGRFGESTITATGTNAAKKEDATHRAGRALHFERSFKSLMTQATSPTTSASDRPFLIEKAQKELKLAERHAKAAEKYAKTPKEKLLAEAARKMVDKARDKLHPAVVSKPATKLSVATQHPKIAASPPSKTEKKSEKEILEKRLSEITSKYAPGEPVQGFADEFQQITDKLRNLSESKSEKVAPKPSIKDALMVGGEKTSHNSVRNGVTLPPVKAGSVVRLSAKVTGEVIQQKGDDVRLYLSTKGMGPGEEGEDGSYDGDISDDWIPRNKVYTDSEWKSKK